MKRLLLLRHAKAVSKQTPRDVDRVLAEAGRSEMTVMAAVLAAEAQRPEVAVVSTAARTRETWERTGLDGVPVHYVDAIYDATPETLLSVVQAIPDEAGSAILIGHNPGIEDLARDLVDGNGDAAALRGLAPGMPTAALVVCDLPVASWREAALGRARLVRYVTPDSAGGRRA